MRADVCVRACARIALVGSGALLDTLARTALWEVGLDFNHGTGHGVGAYLNVHEGEGKLLILSPWLFSAGFSMTAQCWILHGYSVLVSSRVGNELPLLRYPRHATHQRTSQIERERAFLILYFKRRLENSELTTND